MRLRVRGSLLRGTRTTRRTRLLGLTIVVVASVLTQTGLAMAVEGGAIDRSTTHAVAIARGNPSQEAVACSGTLVSANVVLTVRHCIASVIRKSERPCDAELGPVANGGGSVGAGTQSEPDAGEGVILATDHWVNVTPWTGAGSSWKRVASWRVPSALQLCGDDIALLVLADPIGENEAIPARPIVDEAVFLRAASDRRIGLAAFGATGVGTADIGTRRSRFDIPVGCIPGQPGFLCGPELDFIGDRELTTGRGPCHGDSGGGAMTASDSSVIMGVLSRGDRGVDGSTCALGVFERTDVWAWLIARTVLDAATPSSQGNGTARAPDWATALFPPSPKPGDFCQGNGSCGDLAVCASIDGLRSWKCTEKCETDRDCESEARPRCMAGEGICVASSSPNRPATENGCTLTSSAFRQDRSTKKTAMRSSFGAHEESLAMSILLFLCMVVRRWRRKHFTTSSEHMPRD